MNKGSTFESAWWIMQEARSFLRFCSLCLQHCRASWNFWIFLLRSNWSRSENRMAVRLEGFWTRICFWIPGGSIGFIEFIIRFTIFFFILFKDFPISPLSVTYFLLGQLLIVYEYFTTIFFYRIHLVYC